MAVRYHSGGWPDQLAIWGSMSCPRTIGHVDNRRSGMEPPTLWSVHAVPPEPQPPTVDRSFSGIFALFIDSSELSTSQTHTALRLQRITHWAECVKPSHMFLFIEMIFVKLCCILNTVHRVQPCSCLNFLFLYTCTSYKHTDQHIQTLDYSALPLYMWQYLYCQCCHWQYKSCWIVGGVAFSKHRANNVVGNEASVWPLIGT